MISREVAPASRRPQRAGQCRSSLRDLISFVTDPALKRWAIIATPLRGWAVVWLA